ncbi:hypothetical protein NliqN6_3484 [Naganishia liquefaciens]|uniref:Uncharacterized protein n=1 Tax=Naganishia liquefaciens TaxID=104408 RepID=A0A8H3TTW1_9TREE|nr:hypothetical protein NliqN6_3484 [Naganishia liquefaciens]
MSDHPVSADRGRRLEHQERAYRLQVRGGLEGAVKYTVYGTLLVTLGHLTWPLFRRQTLALKGFIVSSAAVTGLVINADNYLLRYESQQRLTENEVRRRARNELAQRGIIATEGEIRKWRREREAGEAGQAGEEGMRDGNF